MAPGAHVERNQLVLGLRLAGIRSPRTLGIHDSFSLSALRLQALRHAQQGRIVTRCLAHRLRKMLLCLGSLLARHEYLALLTGLDRGLDAAQRGGVVHVAFATGRSIA